MSGPTLHLDDRLALASNYTARAPSSANEKSPSAAQTLAATRGSARRVTV
jgi:hypothetical protein